MITYPLTVGTNSTNTNSSTLPEVDFRVSADTNYAVEIVSFALYQTLTSELSLYLGDTLLGTFSAPSSSVRTLTLTTPVVIPSGEILVFTVRSATAIAMPTLNETYLVSTGPIRTHISTLVLASAGTTRVLPMTVTAGIHNIANPEFEPMYGTPNDTGRPRIVAGYTSDGFLDGFYQQPYIAVMQTTLGEWLMSDAGYTPPVLAIPFYQPKQGRGWPTRTLHSNYRPQSG